jgi:excisionase family DNA binding protein
MNDHFVYEAIVDPITNYSHFVHFPELPLAITQGRTRRQIAKNAAETLELALADYILEGKEPPAPVFGHDVPEGGETIIVSVTVTEEDARMMGYVSSKEAAKMLGISKGRVSQLAASGQLESVGTGTARRISLESINERLAHPHPAGRPISAERKQIPAAA